LSFSKLKQIEDKEIKMIIDINNCYYDEGINMNLILNWGFVELLNNYIRSVWWSFAIGLRLMLKIRCYAKSWLLFCFFKHIKSDSDHVLVCWWWTKLQSIQIVYRYVCVCFRILSEWLFSRIGCFFKSHTVYTCPPVVFSYNHF